jgi:hypothetical protein
MKKDINNALDKFLNKNETPTTNQTQNDSSTETLKAKDGLIERIDKTYITESGKILLRD